MLTNQKEIQGLGMPWEKEFGYAQGVKVGDTVWLSGQIGHDDKGTLAQGMDAQVALCYVNIKKLLEGFGFTIEDVVEEVLYVKDMNAAFNARKKQGKEIYANPMAIPSTLVTVSGLALQGQLVEIKIVAKKLL